MSKILIKGYSFIHQNVSAVDPCNDNYSFIYAPSAKSITVKNVGIVFCNPETKIYANSCQEIHRGDWRISNNIIYENDNSDIKYRLDYNKFGRISKVVSVGMFSKKRELWLKLPESEMFIKLSYDLAKKVLSCNQM